MGRTRSWGWPASGDELERVQGALRAATSVPWRLPLSPVVAGVWFASPTGSAGDRPDEPAWVAAVAVRGSVTLAEAVERGRTGAGYRPGLLALREGPLLERVLHAIPVRCDVVLVNATGRDHPRGAGLALHLGAVLDRPSIGVTDRPLEAMAAGEPGPEPGDRVPLVLDGVEVGALLRTRRGVRPIAVHPGWRTDLDTAVDLVITVTLGSRTPEPLRLARRAARIARARDEGRLC